MGEVGIVGVVVATSVGSLEVVGVVGPVGMKWTGKSGISGTVVGSSVGGVGSVLLRLLLPLTTWLSLESSSGGVTVQSEVVNDRSEPVEVPAVLMA